MRRLLTLLLCFGLILAFAVSASAATAAPKASIFATVATDGSCQISMNVTLRLEQADQSLVFPLPSDATQITLNGKRAHIKRTSTAKTIDLADAFGGMAGEFNFTIAYSLDGLLQTSEAGIPQLVLPLLSGFTYPVELLEFSVSMPGEIHGKPAFSSGYHQASIEQSLSAQVSGNTITGQSLMTLKDHETLTMTLDVDETMFPDVPIALSNDSLFDDIAMAVCGVLALLYWLLALRAAPAFGEKTSQPPAGYSAGELGSVLTMQGTQLNMMVLTWAQLGYILIQSDRNHRVLLHKRMEMGNERCGFEQRCFNNLFAGKRVVDTSTQRYAILCEKTEVLSSNVKPLLSPKTGNPRMFRLICAGIGLFGGVALGISLSAGAFLQWFWVVILAALGGVSAWQIQKWAHSLFLLDKRQIWYSLGWCAAWLVLGLIAGLPLVATLVPASQLLAGCLWAFGGRRTLAGRQALKQVLGLRRWLKNADRQQLHRITELDPDYFHSMAPYALALGVDKAFAKQFGKNKIPPCPYLSTGTEIHKTATEWSNLLRRTLDTMSLRQRQLPLERLQKIIASFRR